MAYSVYVMFKQLLICFVFFLCQKNIDKCVWNVWTYLPILRVASLQKNPRISKLIYYCILGNWVEHDISPEMEEQGLDQVQDISKVLVIYRIVL